MTRKRKKRARAIVRGPVAGASGHIRRTIVSLFVAAIGAIQVSSCGTSTPPATPAPSSPPVATAPAGQLVATSFKDCPQFFPGGKPPMVPAAPKLSALQGHFKAAWQMLEGAERDKAKAAYDARKAELDPQEATA